MSIIFKKLYKNINNYIITRWYAIDEITTLFNTFSFGLALIQAENLANPNRRPMWNKQQPYKCVAYLMKK